MKHSKHKVVIPNLTVMADQDFISINWDDHSKTVISQMAKNMEKDLFSDVTLACAGGQCIRAHRLILSIYSDYFRQLLTKCSNPEPTILLPDVELHDLEILITFMYTGKAHVREDNLVNILESAKRFQIKGLLDDVPAIQEGPPAKKRRMDYIMKLMYNLKILFLPIRMKMK